MPEIKFSNPELDPKKLLEFGPISNASEALAEREFITEEGTIRALDLLTDQVIDSVLNKWGLKS